MSSPDISSVPHGGVCSFESVVPRESLPLKFEGFHFGNFGRLDECEKREFSVRLREECNEELQISIEVYLKKLL